MFTQQLIFLKKARTENLKLKNTEDDCLQRQIAQKIPQIENQSLSCQGWSLYGFQTSHFICNWFCCNRSRITSDMLLHAAIWSCCADWFKSEQTPFSQAGRWFRCAALHRIQFGTCCFVPRPMTDQRLSKAMGAALFCNSIQNFILHEKIVTYRGRKFTKHQNLVDSWTESISQEW